MPKRPKKWTKLHKVAKCAKQCHLKARNCHKCYPKSAKSQHYSLSRRSSVTFCKDISQDRIFWHQHCWHVGTFSHLTVKQLYIYKLVNTTINPPTGRPPRLPTQFSQPLIFCSFPKLGGRDKPAQVKQQRQFLFSCNTGPNSSWKSVVFTCYYLFLNTSTRTNLFYKLVLTCIDLFKLPLTCFELFWLILTNHDLLCLALTCLNLFFLLLVSTYFDLIQLALIFF